AFLFEPVLVDLAGYCVEKRLFLFIVDAGELAQGATLVLGQYVAWIRKRGLYLRPSRPFLNIRLGEGFAPQTRSRSSMTLPAPTRPWRTARTCWPQASSGARFSEAKSWR